MTDIVMPRLTDSMEEGTIIAWLKQDGDEVAVGDEIAEIETDKASMSYEADAAGTLRIIVGEGETLPIGETIATVGETITTVGGDGAGGASGGRGEGAAEGAPSGRLSTDSASAESVSPGVPDEPPSTAPDDRSQPPPPGAPPASASDGRSRDREGARIKASPLARRIAADRGVDLAAIRGSGPGGRIIRVDVETAEPGSRRAAGEKVPAVVSGGKGEVETVELDRTQQTIARRMAESKATIPHFVLRTEVDMRRAVAVREAFKREQSADGLPVPSYNDLVVKACARALRMNPRANGAFEDGAFRLYSRVNVGIAVATRDALIVPVVSDADRKDLHEIADESRKLAERVRSGEVTPPELSGATFTVSNLGMFGVTGFDAVINPGQAGILAVGALADRPVIENGEPVPGKTMELSLSCDHRILYGADGARFLATIRAGLEEPGLLA